MTESGLTIVYTGKGKGKTTAALGIALRATGYDKKNLYDPIHKRFMVLW